MKNVQEIRKGRPCKEEVRKIGPMIRVTKRERQIIEKISAYHGMDMASMLRHLATLEYNKLVLSGDILSIEDELENKDM